MGKERGRKAGEGVQKKSATHTGGGERKKKKKGEQRGVASAVAHQARAGPGEEAKEKGADEENAKREAEHGVRRTQRLSRHESRG